MNLKWRKWQKIVLWTPSLSPYKTMLSKTQRYCTSKNTRRQNPSWRKDNSHENQEISILIIKKARTRFKLFLEVKERLPEPDFQHQELTTKKGRTRRKNSKNKQYKQNVSLSHFPTVSNVAMIEIKTPPHFQETIDLSLQASFHCN